MRQTSLAGIVAGSLVLSTVVAAPGAAAQENPASPNDAREALEDMSAAIQDLSDANSSGQNTSSDAKIPELDPNPNDPLHFGPDNVMEKISSSELFLDWTDGMEDGEGKEVVQEWARNSSIPQTANPIELWKMEAQGSAQMSSGLFTGDFATSSGGSSQATSTLLYVLFGWIVVGSLIELVMRGVRMAGF